MNKKDIENSQDIKLLVDSFYDKILNNKQIGFFFTEIIKIKKETHMPVMYQFWESVLLNSNSYKGNPMLKHIAIDKIQRLEPEHFDIWVDNWKETVDELFTGIKSEEIKLKADLMKNLMLHKISESRKSNFIQ